MKITIKIARFRKYLVSSLLMTGLLALAACGGGDADQGLQQTGQHGADARIATHSKGNPPTLPGEKTIAGITFVPPSAWQDLGASGMRQAQFRLPAVSGDSAPGEVNIFYFGPQSGGGVEANLQRWVGQITLAEGVDPKEATTRDTFTADGMAGHVVAINGSYKSGGRPMGGGGTLLPGYRLVGVVLEGPQGSLFFKLTGPLATAKAMESDLMGMVRRAHQ